MLKTCIVIGNGPSLRDVSTEWLEKYPTLGSNRIYLKFTPTYYVCVNPLVLAQYREDIESLITEKYLSEWGKELVDCPAMFLHSIPLKVFSYSPLRYIYEGYTVTYVALQLAFWMGFEQVLMVGVDHKYTFDGAPNQQGLLTGDDPNHFDPTYFKGAVWNNPDLKESEFSYNLALTAFQDNGRRILNLTPDTALDVFEKGDIKEWM
jgi:hypothetical protein